MKVEAVSAVVDHKPFPVRLYVVAPEGVTPESMEHIKAAMAERIRASFERMEEEEFLNPFFLNRRA